ncbi:MAG: hypothetical protein ACTH1D_00645 [Mycobacteriaceae bacterium]|uniref:hypothetical protein n=1 Tax=Corynebacterium sp. TaxID=1720 RepID=UPI003F96AA5C
MTGPHGEFTKEILPEGSEYPDNVILGIPHPNYYEGSASLGNLRLYSRWPWPTTCYTWGRSD